jgi:lipopolysaccharide export system protein LptA
MINKYFYILALSVFLLSSFSVYAENIFQGKQSDEPMEITSDRMEAFNEKKLVVFSGHAMVTQGKNVLKADKLLLYYKNEPGKKEKIGSIETEKAGELEKIEARGNVSLTQGNRVANGDEAVYYRDTNKIVMTGNAVLNEGKSFIKGDRVIVYLNENRGVVESNSQKQVKAIIYPQDRKNTVIK